MKIRDKKLFMCDYLSLELVIPFLTNKTLCDGLGEINNFAFFYLRH